MVLTLCILFATTACNRVYYVDSSTIADERLLPSGFPAGSTFFVETDSKKDDLFDREIGSKLENAICFEGYAIASPEEAAYRVEYTFYMEDTLTQQYAPVYHPSGSYRTFGHLDELDGHYTFHDRTYLYGSTHYVPIEVVVTRYDLKLKVYDNKTNSLVWQGYASSEDCEDEREMINYLIEVALENFGHDSASLQSYKVKGK